MVAARTPNISRAPHVVRRTAATAARPTRSRKASGTRWEEKLRPELEPRVADDARRGIRLLLPTPLLIGEVIASTPRGRVITASQLRQRLAEKFNAEDTCPLMTGMFATILAGVVVEDLTQHRKPRWPVWRLVRDDGTLHPKWPLDPLYRAAMLRQEGVRLTRRRGHWAALDTNYC